MTNRATIVMALIMVFICSFAVAKEYWSEPPTKELVSEGQEQCYKYVQHGTKLGTSPKSVFDKNKTIAEDVIYTFCASPYLDPETGKYPTVRVSMKQWKAWGKPTQIIVEGRKWHPAVVMLGEKFPEMPTDAEIQIYLGLGEIPIEVKP